MDRDAYHALVARLRAQADPVAGFFGPQSITWQINREAVIYLGGMRALLLQIAHPAVAEGVAQYSRFREDPFGRAMRTFNTVHAILFGTPEEAIRAAQRAFAIHAHVRGHVDLPTGTRAFVALDDDLLLWVYATLVDSAMLAYEQFLPLLSREEWERAYQEGRLMAMLFGLAPEAIPPTLDAFQRYMAEMLTSDILYPTPAARAIAESLFRGRWWLRLAAPLNQLLAAGMLPPPLRDAFGLPWGGRRARMYAALVRMIRLVVPYLPPALRFIPAAQQAMRRVAEHEGGEPLVR